MTMIKIKDYHNGYLEAFIDSEFVAEASRYYRSQTGDWSGWVIRNVISGAYSEVYPNKREAIEILREFADDHLDESGQ